MRKLIKIKTHKYMLYSLLFAVMMLSCGGESSSNQDNVIEEQEIIPSNLSFDVEIIGESTDYPNGDGKGIVRFSASAKDAENYRFVFGTGDDKESTSGQVEYTYSNVGTNNYTVTVYAISSTQNSVSKFKNITVFVKEPELTLVWSDEFDTDGAIDSSKWNHEVVPPDNEVNWWNGEKQHYTDRLDNSYVSEGTLKIVAKKEDYVYENSRGEQIAKNYTSARITTQDKYEFTYGRIDVRAKLPSGEGTWPAIWTLGANIDEVNWPACGEIDIMEHWGHEPSEVSSATHNTACHGGCNNVTVGKTTIPDYDTEFHVYSVVWTEEELRFLIDGEFKYRYKPSQKNNENWPYTEDQFIILNVAMGGSWFEIDTNFTESVMEIDYVRVYQ